MLRKDRAACTQPRLQAEDHRTTFLLLVALQSQNSGSVVEHPQEPPGAAAAAAMPPFKMHGQIDRSLDWLLQCGINRDPRHATQCSAAAPSTL